MVSSAGLDKKTQEKYSQPTIRSNKVQDPITAILQAGTPPPPTDSGSDSSGNTKVRTPKKEKKVNVSDLPRYESRLWPDVNDFLVSIHTKAGSATHPSNKGIQNAEMFHGMVRFIMNFEKLIKLTGLNFKRGRLYGEGSENLKREMQRIFTEAGIKWVLQCIIKWNDESVINVVEKLKDDEKLAIIDRIGNLKFDKKDKIEEEEFTEEKEVVNG